jgi:LacI family transcriptional regulator
MANIYDVAKAARVSLATVSAVVNDSAYVSPALKVRVNAAIRTLGYRPNLIARGLAMRQSHTIGMIAPNIANPFWPEVVRGVEDAVHARGYTLLVASSDDDLRKEALYLNLFLAKRVDGILLCKAAGGLAPDLAAQLKGSRTPVVQLMRTSRVIRGDAVITDDQAASYEAVTHLSRLGYTRIAMISGVAHVSTSRRRLAGYRQALKDSGIKVDPALIEQGNFRVESGYTAGIELLRRKPDAVFIGNYLMTVGFMRALRQHQLECPDDVAIITCDDHPWLDSFRPRLTTVNFPKYEIGREGARVLIDTVEAGPRVRDARRFRTVVIKSALSIRESCGYELRAMRRTNPRA